MSGLHQQVDKEKNKQDALRTVDSTIHRTLRVNMPKCSNHIAPAANAYVGGRRHQEQDRRKHIWVRVF